ncbi:MAG: flagellar protein FlaG [Thermotogaceae bacterium]|jgi:flagellar protein FlaG|nr:flagellar protein FlaG [Thermotogaceae bacterium]
MGFNIDRIESTNSVRPAYRNDVTDRDQARARQTEKASEKDNESYKNVEQAVEELEKGIQMLKDIQMGDLKIEFDKEADMKVVKIVDHKTGEVLKEIPPKEIVELAKNLNEMLGILFDKWA